MADLRQSTSQIIRFGPFLDQNDGFTPLTTLTIAQSDMRLSKDGAAFGQKNTAGNAIHDSNGWYSTTFDSTDTATTGILEFEVTVATALPFFKTYKVITQTAYDSINTGTFNNFDFTSDFVQVGTNNDKTGYSISGTLNTLDDLENLAQTDVVTSGAIQTAVGVVVNVGIVQNLNTIDDGAIMASTIASGALNGKGDWNIGKTDYTLTQTFPGNFDNMIISATGDVNSDVNKINSITVIGTGVSFDLWRA